MHRVRCVEPFRIARLIIARKWGHKQGLATFPAADKKKELKIAKCVARSSALRGPSNLAREWALHALWIYMPACPITFKTRCAHDPSAANPARR